MSGPRPDGGGIATALPLLPRAACIGTDPAIFFGPDNEKRGARNAREAKARAICEGCPVAAPCLDWALSRPLDAIAGGLNEPERRTLARLRGIPRLCPAWRHVIPAGASGCRPCRLASQLASQHRAAAARAGARAA